MSKYDIATKPGAVDKYRRSIPGSGLGRVLNTEAWGTTKACERYGPLQTDTRPKDTCYPQFKEDQRGPDWKDDHPNDRVRGANEDGRPPNFDRGYRGKGK